MFAEFYLIALLLSQVQELKDKIKFIWNRELVLLFPGVLRKLM